MYFHINLIPRDAYFLLPLESKQEATSGWNFTKCISEVKVNQLKVKNMHVKMGISTFKVAWFFDLDFLYNGICCCPDLQNPELKILFQSDIQLLRY